MVDKLIRLTAEQRSNFVAYLDGELDDPETQQIEQLLSNNEVARHDMESLATAWELLDELPRATAPKDFAEKTIATLKLEEHQTPLNEQAWFLKATRIGNLILAWGLVACCGVVGFSVARNVPPSKADALIHNYPLLKNLDSYKEIGSTDFIRSLQKNEEWTRAHSGNAQGGSHE